MKFKGIVKDGVVVLEDGASIPDGTEVEVAKVSKQSTVGQRLMKFSGKAKGLPPDASEEYERHLRDGLD